MEATATASGGPLISPGARPHHVPGLSDDAMLHILGFLSLGDLATFCQLSEGCNEIASSNAVWRPLARRFSRGQIRPHGDQKGKLEAYLQGIKSGRLLEAVVLRRFERISQLLSEGASPNVVDPLTGVTPLHHAAALGQVNAINALMQAGATLDTQDAKGRTPLHHAAARDQVNAINALTQAGARPDAQDAQGGTPLHCAAVRDQVNAIDALMQAGATLDTQDAQGGTPLHCAAARDLVNAINALAQAGATLDAQDAIGWTPLHQAAARDQVNAINALAQAGATLDAQDAKGRTPLHHAAARDQVNAINALTQAGATLDAQDAIGWTPLHCAARFGQFNAINALLRAGVNRHIESTDWQTAFDLAFQEKHYDIVAILDDSPSNAPKHQRDDAPPQCNKKAKN